MFNLFGLVCILYSAVQIIKEAFEKPIPKEAKFDWDAYYEDIRNGMTTMQQIEKRKKGEYLTTKFKSTE